MAHADRRTSLQGNRLIEDPDDVFIFPHLAHTYQDRVALDYRLANGMGSALFLTGSEAFAWGVALDRGNLFDSAELTGQPELDALGGLESPQLEGYQAGALDPYTALDLFLSGRLFGTRLSLGTNMAVSDEDTLDEDLQRTRFARLAMSVGALEGWDISLHLGAINSTSRRILILQDRTNQFRAAGVARGYIQRARRRDLGLLFSSEYAYQRASNTTDNVTTGTTTHVVDLDLGFGPRFVISDRIRVATYFLLGYETLTVMPDGQEVSSRQERLLPGANIAAEAAPRPWLRVRGGMEYALTGISTGDEIQLDRYLSEMRWSAGVGFVHRDFDLNIALASALPQRSDGLSDPIDPMNDPMDPVDPLDPVDPMDPQDTDLLGQGLGALTGGLPTLMVSAIYRFGPESYEEIPPSPPQEVIVRGVSAAEPPPEPQPTAPRPTVVQPREIAPTTTSPSQPPSVTPPPAEPPTDRAPKADEEEEDTSDLQGTPPPPGEDGPYRPVKPL